MTELGAVSARGIAGVGLGLRWELEGELTRDLPPLDFLEVSPENYVGRGGHAARLLSAAAARYPIVTHGLAMSLGGSEPLDERYLREVRAFVADVRSPWHSDHLCFGRAGGVVLHDLLPLRLCDATVDHVAGRVRRAEDALGVPMAVENISFYVHPGARELAEPELVARVCERAGCKLLFDVNNAFVNATNFGYDPRAWLDPAVLRHVVQLHVAGHTRIDDVLVDTHGADVSDPVLDLLAEVVARTGPVPIVLERDQEIPPLADLLVEIETIRRVAGR